MTGRHPLKGLGDVWDAATAPLWALRIRHPVIWRFACSVVLTSLALLGTYFVDPNTNYNMAIAASMSIVILGLSFLTGASGQVSLGNGAFMGVGAFTMAIWANHHTTTPIAVTLVISLAAGGAVGLLIGLPATRLRGPYLAGMTITFALAFPNLLTLFNSWTGGDSGLQLPTLVAAPQWLVDLLGPGASALAPDDMWYADICIVTVGIAFFLMANLFSSRTGRAMRLVRDNEVAAELAGVSLPHARVLAFVVSAAYAGLGGALATIVSNSVSPSTYNLSLSITILSLLVIGGMGTLSGALIGGVIFAYSGSGVTWIVNQTGIDPYGNLATNLSGIIFGALLMVTILIAPFGIAGTTKMLTGRASQKRRAARLLPSRS